MSLDLDRRGLLGAGLAGAASIGLGTGASAASPAPLAPGRSMADFAGAMTAFRGVVGADVNVAWPTAQIAVMGAQGAANILHRKTLKKVADAGGDVEAKRAELIDEYERTLANPYMAAERGYIDAVIAPHRTRLEVVRALRLLKTKRETLPAKKHGNIPL